MAFNALKGAMKPSKVKGPKAGPNGSFPIGDKKHARLAISGATRSENAGHISAATAAQIKAKARRKLGKDDANGPSKKKKLPPHMRPAKQMVQPSSMNAAKIY
jgi:hypothetical protein